MFASTPKTNNPAQYRTQQTYAPTFTGPITQDQGLTAQQRGESMAKAAFAGDMRQYMGQSQKGVGAGGKMSAFRAGLLADSESSKAYAQAQQDMLNANADRSAANLLFQERQAGESGWLRDLLLDREDIRTQERKSAYKRKADVDIGDYERRVQDAVARDRRQAEIVSAML